MKPHADPSADRAAPGAAGDELEPLVSRALELRDEGRADWLAEACRGRPETEAAVRAAVERVDTLPEWIDGAAGRGSAPAQRLGERFRLLERIGAGAMGVVYLAEDLELRRKVACKVVHHGLMPPEEALERFAREAEAMAAVQHPAVVTIHDRGRTEGGQVYIVMELVDGPPVSEFLAATGAGAERARGDAAAWIESELAVSTRGETSRLRTVVRWVADLAAGLEAVHRAGVLHRDVKPSNMLLRRDGRPVLIDFGIALLGEQGTGTRTGTSVGTPSYMPPEALRRGSPRTPASDVYGLAATLYHLLTLHAPYEGTPTEILAQLATVDPVPASKRRPGLPRDLQAILDTGMHRDPARRYPSAAAFEADLRAFLEFRPVAARPVTRVERAMRRLARSRATLGALVALACVVIAVGSKAAREAVIEGRREQHAALLRRFPPNFSIVHVANREYRHDADRAALAELLDDAAEVAVEPLPTFLLRASFRQDHGDPAGAAEDMRAVADFVDTPFARELAARYAGADGAKRGIAALDLAKLPEPGGAVDRYLAGYHAMRRGKSAEAIALLGDPEVRRIAHAEEMFLASTDFERLPDRPSQRRLAVERFADLVRLEERIGARTATTAHVAARLLAVQDRHDEALRACADGVVLAPRAFVLRINAGYCAFVEGRTDEARAHYAVARDLRPNWPQIANNLLDVEVAEARYDAARTFAEDAAPQLVPPQAEWLDWWLGKIATFAALDAHAAGDVASRKRLLEEARGHFERSPKHVFDADGRPKDPACRIAQALEKDDPQALLLELLDLLANKPQGWWERSLLLRHFPPEMDARATVAMRRVLEASDNRTSGTSSK